MRYWLILAVAVLLGLTLSAVGHYMQWRFLSGVWVGVMLSMAIDYLREVLEKDDNVR